MGSGPNWYRIGKKHVIYQSLQILCKKKDVYVKNLEKAICGI